MSGIDHKCQSPCLYDGSCENPLHFHTKPLAPSATVDAAKALDEYLVDFVLKLTACKCKYDSLPDEREKQRIVNQILLQISRGGVFRRYAENGICWILGIDRTKNRDNTWNHPNGSRTN